MSEQTDATRKSGAPKEEKKKAFATSSASEPAASPMKPEFDDVPPASISSASSSTSSSSSSLSSSFSASSSPGKSSSSVTVRIDGAKIGSIISTIGLDPTSMESLRQFYSTLLRGKEQIGSDGGTVRNAIEFLEIMKGMKADKISVSISIAFLEHPRIVLATGRTKKGAEAGNKIDNDAMLFLPQVSGNIKGREAGFETLNVRCTLFIALIGLQFYSRDIPIVSSWIAKYKSRPFEIKEWGSNPTMKIRSELVSSFQSQLALDASYSTRIGRLV